MNANSASSQGPRTASAATPIPTQIVSNGEYLPPRQSATQKKVERRIVELADANAKRLGLDRRQFLRTELRHGGGLRRHERDLRRQRLPGDAGRGARARAGRRRAPQGLAGQFIFDVQTHFVRDDFDHKQLLGLAEFASQHWNPKMKAGGRGLARPLQIPELREGGLLRQRHQPGAC